MFFFFSICTFSTLAKYFDIFQFNENSQLRKSSRHKSSIHLTEMQHLNFLSLRICALNNGMIKLISKNILNDDLFFVTVLKLP